MADQRDYGDENDFHRDRTPEQWVEVIVNGAVARRVGDCWLTIDVGPLGAQHAVIAPPIYGKQMTLDELEVTGQVVYEPGSQPTICPICGGLETYGKVHICGGGA